MLQEASIDVDSSESSDNDTDKDNTNLPQIKYRLDLIKKYF